MILEINHFFLLQPNNQSATSTGLIESTISTESVSIGHHKLPEQFIPPPDYIQPNDKLIVISSSNRDKQYEVSNLAEIFAGASANTQCLVEPKKSNAGKRAIVSIWKKFDDLMQNKYVWTIFTVLLGSIPPLAKAYYDRRRKVMPLLKTLA